VQLASYFEYPNTVIYVTSYISFMLICRTNDDEDGGGGYDDDDDDDDCHSLLLCHTMQDKLL